MIKTTLAIWLVNEIRGGAGSAVTALSDYLKNMPSHCLYFKLQFIYTHIFHVGIIVFQQKSGVCLRSRIWCVLFVSGINPNTRRYKVHFRKVSIGFLFLFFKKQYRKKVFV